MRTRRVPMSADHVGALNLIEIEFADEPDVLAAWKLLYQHFATEHVRRPDEQRMPHATLEESRQRDNLFDKRLFDERQRLFAKVLHSMAKTLNFNIEQLEIFEGGYTPQGWQDELLEQRMARNFILDLYRGRAALPVAVLSVPGAPDGAERPKLKGPHITVRGGRCGQLRATRIEPRRLPERRKFRSQYPAAVAEWSN